MNLNQIKSILSKTTTIKIYENYPLNRHTSLGVGGNADLFCIPQTQDDLIKIYRTSQKENIPVFILGDGTNILISDKGIRGITIKNNIENIKFERKYKGQIYDDKNTRKQETHFKKGFIKFNDLDYNDRTTQKHLYKISSGTNLQKLILQTIKNNSVGLQWFSRIPGTIGGAVYNNIHGANRLFSEYIEKVKYIDNYGEVITLSHNELNFGYNQSIFQKINGCILEVELGLYEGNSQKALYTYNEWKKRKSIQPFNSAGSTFSNITEEERDKAGLKNLSAGYIIDAKLNLKGYKIGGAKIYENHANFIVTDNTAKAKDVYDLIKLVQQKAKEELDIKLKPEIFLIGEFK